MLQNKKEASSDGEPPRLVGTGTYSTIELNSLEVFPYLAVPNFLANQGFGNCQCTILDLN